MNPHQDETRTVGLYARVSTTDQNTNLQIDGLRAMAAHRGWQIAAEYVDTGRVAPRPAAPSSIG